MLDQLNEPSDMDEFYAGLKDNLRAKGKKLERLWAIRSLSLCSWDWYAYLWRIRYKYVYCSSNTRVSAGRFALWGRNGRRILGGSETVRVYNARI
jgi:hypothetical protein